MSTRRARLAELFDAHARMGGTGRGRRYRTGQINRALVVLLVAEFQGFCRDLHSEACTVLARVMSGSDDYLFRVVFGALTAKRKLDIGNPTQATLQDEFGRLDLDLRAELVRSHAFNEGRWRKLGQVLDFRNAIAHSDPRKLPFPTSDTYDVKLSQVKSWMWAMHMLANQMDIVVSRHIASMMGGGRPW